MQLVGLGNTLTWKLAGQIDDTGVVGAPLEAVRNTGCQQRRIGADMLPGRSQRRPELERPGRLENETRLRIMLAGPPGGTMRGRAGHLEDGGLEPHGGSGLATAGG